MLRRDLTAQANRLSYRRRHLTLVRLRVGARLSDALLWVQLGRGSGLFGSSVGCRAVGHRDLYIVVGCPVVHTRQRAIDHGRDDTGRTAGQGEEFCCYKRYTPHRFYSWVRP